MNKTTIILSNLNKEDFLSNNRTYTEFEEKASKKSAATLSFVDRLKLDILNNSLRTPAGESTEYSTDYYLTNITHWSSLPFLSRVIIILSSEEVASNLYSFLQQYLKDQSHVRVSLQENLLQRSKSFEGLDGQEDENSLTVLTKFKSYYNSSSGSDTDDGSNSPVTDSGEYVEPKPRAFNAYEDLTKMGIDLSAYNNEDQITELKESSQSSPTIPPLLRTRSLTKTLFKPDLKIQTEVSSKTQDIPPSPTITLDESF